MRLLWCLSLAVLVTTEEVVEVSLEGLGAVRGKTGEARNGDTIYQFLGIPFAEPPTGENRYNVRIVDSDV